VKGKTAVDVAREMLVRFGGLRGLLTAERTDVCATPGLGEAKYVQLQAALELGRRFLGEKLARGAALQSAAETREFLQAHLRDREAEYFCCLFLDNRHRVLAFEELFRGTLNRDRRLSQRGAEARPGAERGSRGPGPQSPLRGGRA